MILRERLHVYAERVRIASSEKRYSDTVKIVDELRADLTASPPDEQEVLVLLQEIRESSSTPECRYGFIAAWCNLSRSYVPILCEIVALKTLNAVHEPAIELLCELGDERALDVLKKAVSYRWEYDQWFHVPRKALRGLSKIGNQEAIESITAAATSMNEEIKNEAIEIIGEFGDD